jgi:hypothetical protein
MEMVDIEFIKEFDVLFNDKISCAEVKITSHVFKKPDCYNKMFQDIIIPELRRKLIKNIERNGDSIVIEITDDCGAERILDNLVGYIGDLEKNVSVQDVVDDMNFRLRRIIKMIKGRYCKSVWY